MTLQAREESRSVLRIPAKSGVCMSYEDTIREMEAYLDGKIDNPQSTRDVYADITEPIRTSSSTRLPDSEDPNATENSSSFEDTISRNEMYSGASDAEVESEFRIDSVLAPSLDSYSNAFFMRKRKVTAHWRSFIRPLMWRCKWTELKIRELESQALKYSRELEANEQTKFLGINQYTPDICSKSFPYFSHLGKKKLLKRRKRKPVEKNGAISAQHPSSFMISIWSTAENKKSDQDGPSVADDDVNIDSCPRNDDFGMDEDWLKVGDESLEQIFQQIETVQSQVHRLRADLDMVMLKNGVKFSSENLSLLTPYDAQTSAAQSPVLSAGNGDNMSIGAVYISEHITDFEMGDLVFPDSIISGYKDVAQIPDIIESTAGLLSAADATKHQPQESGENILDDIHIQSRAIQERQMSCGALDQLNAECQILVNEAQNNISSLQGIDGLMPNTTTGDPMVEEKLTLKSCLVSDVRIPKNKRKRCERKAGIGGWNMKSAGEPNSL